MRIPTARVLAFTLAALLIAPGVASATDDPAEQGLDPSATSSPSPSSADAAAIAADPAAAAKDFRFFGSGFGHGLGMSQWGAYGLARDGWTATRIVQHYYSGTNVSRSDGPKNLRIGLAQGQQDVRLEAIAGPVKLHLNGPGGKVVATIPGGATWRVRVADTHYRIIDGSGDTVDRAGGPNSPIVATYGGRVRIPEAGHVYNRGVVEFGLYDCGGSCSMRLILVVDPEEYLYGLGEVPSSWPMEAMKAQAIAARTYAFTKARAGQHRSVCDCALYASSYDQVYAGYDKEGGPDGERWVHAVNATEGKVVKDSGTSIQAFYMSSSGGYTEDNENVWGGSPVSYLRGVCDPGDYTDANPSATWDVSMTAGTVTTDLGLGIGVVTGFGNARRGVSGRIVSIVVKGQDGRDTISGATLRSELALRDDRLWIDSNRQIVGPIRQKYDALNCSPGLPRSRQTSVAGGKRQSFEDGNIYVADATGAHEVHGPVLAAYLDANGPGGNLGFPTSDVRRLASGALRSRFQHGVITCGDATCRVVTG